MDTTNAVVFAVVVGLRLGVPLLIPRFPLPAMLAALVLDGVDQTVFQQLTTLNLDGYQSYDKALDVYYLAIAYLATLRNWTHQGAFRVSRFLLYYRFAGVLAFELTGIRALLLIFPNTFEYFFDFYEGVRARWDPRRVTFRFWVLSAAAIWVFIKLPQEWWIHVAQLDTTDLMRAHPTATVLLAVVAAVLFAVAWRIVVPRLPDADHRWTFAAERVPSDVDPAALETYWARYGRVLSLPVLEKVALISLVCAVFAEMLPSVDATPVQVTFAVAVVVVADAAVSLWTARLGRRPLTAVGGFAAVAAVNAGLVLLDRLVLRPDRGPATGTTLFFVLLLALIVSLYDRYRPVYALRFAADATAAAAVKSPEPNRAVEGADPLRRRFHRGAGGPPGR